jgi:crossover junction endodeoxyribonuclease RuvC
MVILGIDPGSRITGFGVVELSGSAVAKNWDVRHRSHGVIVLDPQADFAERMKQLANALQTLLSKYQPQQVVIEKIFLGKNADSAFKLGHARGVAMSEAARAQAVVIEYATRVIKKGIVGNGGASKQDVQNCLQRLLKIKAIEKLDASDALALATFQAFQLMNPLSNTTLLGNAGRKVEGFL